MVETLSPLMPPLALVPLRKQQKGVREYMTQGTNTFIDYESRIHVPTWRTLKKRDCAGDIPTVVLSVPKNDFSVRDFKMICKLGLSPKYVRGPLGRFLCRRMVFHRFDHATHRLDATLLCPAHRDKVLSVHQFFAV